MKTTRNILWFGFALIWLAATAQAQMITGSMVGQVEDPSGLAIVGAEVTLTVVATGVERTTTTNEAGRFSFSALNAGDYKLLVTCEGFRGVERSGIVLTTGQRLPLGTIAMEIGAVNETVSVTAEREAVVLTESSERSDLITEQQVDNLLNLGRNVTDLVGLLPGVVVTRSEAAINRRTDFNVAGNRRTTNNISIDGVPAVDVGNAFAKKLVVSQDMVAEVKILTTNYQAEYGRMAGSNMHIITKSGTQDFHGLFSYFKRHEQFNANNFFNNRNDVAKPRYRFNTYTYNIGGPVYVPGKLNKDKNKIFFFWGQEFWPNKTGTNGRRTMPTELERAGDFSQTLDLNGKVIQINDPFNGGQPFPGNVIPSSRVDPSGQALLKRFDMPNYFDRSISKGQYNYIYSTDTDKPTRTDTGKLDFNLTEKDFLMAAYSGYYERAEGQLGFPTASSNWPQWKYGFDGSTQGTSLRYTRIVSPTIINELSFAWLRHPEENFYDDSALTPNQRATIGYTAGQFNPENNPLDLIPDATFGGVPSAPQLQKDGRWPFTAMNHVFNWDEKLTVTKGSHTIKGGIYVEYFKRDIARPVEFAGQFNFARSVNNPLDTNYAFSNAALGVYNTYTEASARPHAYSENTLMEGFIQDNWKARQKLTLDVGMRFYWMPPITEENNDLAGFAADRWDRTQMVQLVQPGRVGGNRVGVHPVTGEVFPASQIGAIAPDTGDPVTGMVVAGEDGYPRGLTKSQGILFGPRFGFAYDVFGNGKTAVRGGFGLFYNRQNFGTYTNTYQAQPPLVFNPVYYYGTVANLTDSSGVLFPSAVQGIDGNAKLPTVMNYSFSVQQDIGFSTVVDVAYVASLGRHLLWKRDINPVAMGANFDPDNADPTTGKPLPASFLRPRTGYNAISILEPAGSSSYHSLQVSANRRFRRGLQFGASWTWSKAMDFNDNDGNAITSLVDPRVWNYGLAGFDRTHIVKINYLWDVPQAPVSNPVLKQVVNGWQLSGVTSFISGDPTGVGYSFTKSIDITGSASQGARVVVLGDPVLPKSERTFSRNFDTGMFAPPEVGTIGNSARTILRGPGVNNWDVAIFKNFPIREAMRIQFRWEMYNAFNHTQFSNFDTAARFDPAGNQVNTRFGEYTAARSPRIMQFSLRFMF